MDIDEAAAACDAVLEAVGGAVVAERSFLQRVLLGVLARGHVLLEDVPGTGKTLTARSVATALGLEFSRVQFTPDLLPTDVTGTNVYNEGEGSFEFSPGPVFANVVLADEINRAPPKTQAALLEAMEEEQVTVDGDTHPLPDPFFVIATQNPVEQEGSLHPDETLYMNGELWRAGDALAYAQEHGQLLAETDDTRLYDVDVSTQSLTPERRVERRPCLVYETDYEGHVFGIRTESGRSVRVSGNHPFLVNRTGTLQWVEARDLSDSDALVVPTQLENEERSLPRHGDALDSLRDDYSVVERETLAELRERLRRGDELSNAELDRLRIGAGLSKRELSDRVPASYDRVLNFLQGADTDLGDQLGWVLSEAGFDEGDAVESHRIVRFEEPLSEREAGFFVGFVLSDGHFTDESVRIYQKNFPDQFDRWVDMARQLGFSPRIREIRGGREAAIDSKPLVDYLDARYDLRNPTGLLDAPEPFKHAFLDIFMLAESHYDADNTRVTFTQEDRETTNLIAHLLLQFGIRPWIRDEGRVYRLRVQGEDVPAFREQFTWPGAEPERTEFDSAHRTTPVNVEQMERIIETLGIRLAGDMSDREWYNALRRLREGADSIRDGKLRTFVDDVNGELDGREGTDVAELARSDIGTAARQCGLSLTDVTDATGETKHEIWQAYQGRQPPESAVEYVVDTHTDRTREARSLTAYVESLISGDVCCDRIASIESNPYRGTVIGLSVPETHNYVAGLGACGVNHNTFPLPEAQVDRFAVKTAIGYPDVDGEVELLRRRAGRTTRSPTVDPVLDGADVTALRRTPEDVRVDADLLTYMAELSAATRRDRRVEVGVSPRGTQRLFETARARAVLEARGFVTPDDIKAIAESTLAHRLVLTPDAQVNDVEKSKVIADVLENVEVPTVE